MSEVISLQKNLQKKVKRDTKKIKKKILKSGNVNAKPVCVRIKDLKKAGVMLLSHIPHGFYEEELEKYFSQFGRVLSLHLCRSSKTGKSKGSAFILFADKEVAKVAAETMDNYLMFNKRMTAKFLTLSETPKRIFSVDLINETNLPLKKRQEKMNEAKNAPISDEVYKKSWKEKVINLKRIKRKLAECGVDYDIEITNAPLQNMYL